MHQMSESCAIPATAPRRYLSGMAALNVLSEDGTGDSHPYQFLRGGSARRPRTFLVEDGMDIDAIAILGDAGIYNCAAVLDRMGVPHPPGPVWSGEHHRAIADMVLVAVACGEDPSFVALDDWMPRDADKASVFNLLRAAMEQLAPTNRDAVRAWMDENREGLSASRSSRRGFTASR
jgi:hypothetical protein